MALDFFAQFSRTVEHLPEQVALQAIGEEGREGFTYAEIDRAIRKIGSLLQSAGVKEGDAVGIIMENHPRWGMAFLAAQSAGSVVVPLDVLHDAATLAELIRHAQCTFLITSEKMLEKFQEIQALLPHPLPALLAGKPIEGCLNWEEALRTEAGTGPLPLVKRGPQDPLVLIYTSGTTGNPKGVLLSRENIYSNTVELLKVIQVSPADHVLSVLPLYHVLALMANFIIPLYVGARVTYLDVLEAQRILKAFREERITLFVCVPQFYYLVHGRIMQQLQQQKWFKRWLFRRLLSLSRFCVVRLRLNAGKLLFRPVHRPFGSRLRYFGVGGARFESHVAESFRDLGFRFIQAYGMTETAALATVTPPGSPVVGSVGKPLGEVEIRIDDPGEDGSGEVLIRGPNVMSGYWRNAEATEDVLRNGWLHSGDLGFLDKNGLLHITGRKKDVIVLSSGKNIYPEEIEHYYQVNCPYIKEICVLGMSDESSGRKQEKLHGVIVPDWERLRAEQVVNASDMIRYLLETLSQKLPSYKRLKSFDIRHDPLPRTTTRKIKRFQLQQELLSARPEAPRFQEESEPRSAVEARVFELVRRLQKIAVLNREMNLELDVGLDSLQRVELLSSLQEAFQIAIPDDEAARILTIQDLVQAVEDRCGEGDLKEIPEAETARSWREILGEPLNPEDSRRLQEILVRRPWVEVLILLIARFVFVIGKVLFGLKASGLENLPDRYPFLICPNHLSFLDAFLLAGVLPFRVIRRQFLLGYSDYFSGSLYFWGRLLKVIPVNADRHLRQALRLGAEGLRRDLVLVVFPEGERSIDGTLKVFRKGPAILARELEVPVVPAGIVGTYEAWRRGSNKIRLHPVRIHFGKLLPAPRPETSYEDFNERLFQAVQKAIDEARRDLHSG